MGPQKNPREMICRGRFSQKLREIPACFMMALAVCLESQLIETVNHVNRKTNVDARLFGAGR